MEDNIKKSLIEKAMAQVECYPLATEETAIQEYIKMPLGQLASFGATLSSVAPMLRNVAENGNGETLYRMVVPNGLRAGERLTVAKSGGYLGNIASKETGQITQRARYFEVPHQTVPIDPTTMLMAVAIASITSKLEAIEETQKDIIEFLQLKEKAILKGNVLVLQEIIDEYKYNWDNEKYKNSKYIQVQEIKRDAEQSIIFCRDQISKKATQKGLFHSDRDVRTKIQKVNYEFKDYELALYMFAFSSFLEVMLLENFDEGYLNAVAEKIKLYANEYHDLHEKCYELIEGDSKTSIEAHVIRGVAGLNKIMGKTIAKIPKVRDGQMDENLISAGERVDDFNEKRTVTAMELLSNAYATCVDPFVENIQAVNRVYNQPVEMLFDRENIYFCLAG